MQRTPQRTAKIARVLKDKQPDLTVVCENIHDSHNVSAILRTCDAVGIPEVQLYYQGQEFPTLHPKTSSSASKWMPTRWHHSADELQTYLKTQKMTIYGTHLSHDAISIYEVDWTQPSAIILGNERDGISDSMRTICDANIHIPMFGMIESLNVSVATAVILYEAARQRISGGRYPFPDWDEEMLQEKLKLWLKK